MVTKKKKAVKPKVPGYPYDVAFSFLTEDEPLAQRINDEIASFCATFIYSNHQDKLSGSDGLSFLSDVFQNQARVVVVLYRDGWGETDWTRIEETQLKDRYLKQGPGFILFIEAKLGAKSPIWYPSHMIYHDLETFGEENIPGIVLQKVREHHGSPNKLSVIERAERHAIEEKAKSDRDSFLFSGAGVAAVKSELRILHQDLNKIAKEITEKTSLSLLPYENNNERLYALFSEDEFKQIKQSLSVRGEGLTLNSATDFSLYVETWEEWPARIGIHYFDEPKRTKSVEFKFDRNLKEQIVWRLRDKHFTTTLLAEYCIDLLMEQEKKPK